MNNEKKSVTSNSLEKRKKTICTIKSQEREQTEKVAKLVRLLYR